MEELVAILKNKELTLSCAESLTCGLFASYLGKVPGVSRVFKGGAVTYMNEAKVRLLNIEPALIEEYGVVSEECASKMARGIAHALDTDVAISFTGNAGPSVLEGKEVGLVYIGIYIKGTTFVFENHFQGDRDSIRETSVKVGKEKLLQLLQ